MQDFEASDGVVSTNIDATITTTRMGVAPVKTDTKSPTLIEGYSGLTRKTKVRSIKGKVLNKLRIVRFFGFKGQYLCPMHYLITAPCPAI
jgi:hypothetical protein